MKNNMPRCLFLMITLVAAGCGSSRQAGVAHPGSELHSYLFSNEVPGRSFGGYSYILLTSRAQPDDKIRYERMRNTAASYLANFAYLNEATSHKDPAKIMLTYWMMKAPHARFTENAETLLEKYDYDRAYQMLTAVNRLGKSGPILVAWERPFEDLEKAETRKYLMLDLSTFSNDDIDRAFKIWRQMLSEGGGKWHSGKNKLIRFRETTRNLFQQYGDFLIDLISIVP